MQISSQESPYFSIIIPSYNRAKFLLDTITGVLSQDFTNFELLVIVAGMFLQESKREFAKTD